MAADIVDNFMVPGQLTELVVHMDDYGTVVQTYVPVSHLAARDELIALTESTMSANQLAAEEYAAKVGLALPSKLGPDEKKASYAARSKPASSSMTVKAQAAQ